MYLLLLPASYLSCLFPSPVTQIFQHILLVNATTQPTQPSNAAHLNPQATWLQDWLLYSAEEPEKSAPFHFCRWLSPNRSLRAPINQGLNFFFKGNHRDL